MKYKELYALQTNTFKVYDRVKVYSDHYIEEGIICNIDPTKNYLQVDFKDDSRLVHFKQCRKLEEVKPREFYVQPLYLVEMKPHPQCGFNFIKVREVLED